MKSRLSVSKKKFKRSKLNKQKPMLREKKRSSQLPSSPKNAVKSRQQKSNYRKFSKNRRYPMKKRLKKEKVMMRMRKIVLTVVNLSGTAKATTMRSQKFKW
jgi:Mrp family chromosome partitioning ATPase